MNLKQIFTPQMIFRPDSFYDGEWSFGGVNNNPEDDYLALNSKCVVGKNLYFEFLNMYYFNPLSQMLLISEVDIFYPSINYVVDNKCGIRMTKYSLFMFIDKIINFLFEEDKNIINEFMDLLDKDVSDDELINFIKLKLREDKKKYSDVLKNGKNSVYYEKIYNDYYNICRNRSFSFEFFVDETIQLESNLLVGSKYYKSFFDKEINIEALLKCFDYDTFCLVLAKSAMEMCLEVEKETNLVCNISNYLYSYVEAVKLLKKEKPNYLCKMSYREDGKKLVYNSDQLINEFEKFLFRHPEFSFVRYSEQEVKDFLKQLGFNDDFINDFNPRTEKCNELIKMFYDYKNGQSTLGADWILIPKGEKNSDLVINSLGNLGGKNLDNNYKISEEQKIRRMLYSKTFLQNSNYVYKVYGINHFKGYIGYIYSNGCVIMEKFYEDVDEKIVVNSAATYVMNIYNFIEISKMSKIEIIDLIMNDPNSGVRRIFHVEQMDRWASKVSRCINGNDYNDDVKRHIDGLIDKNKLIRGKKYGYN